MSRHNKANRDRYVQAGRLTPDDMARERQRQMRPVRHATRARVTNRADDRGTARLAGLESSRRRSGRQE